MRSISQIKDEIESDRLKFWNLVVNILKLSKISFVTSGAKGNNLILEKSEEQKITELFKRLGFDFTSYMYTRTKNYSKNGEGFIEVDLSGTKYFWVKVIHGAKYQNREKSRTLVNLRMMNMIEDVADEFKGATIYPGISAIKSGSQAKLKAINDRIIKSLNSILSYEHIFSTEEKNLFYVIGTVVFVTVTRSDKDVMITYLDN